MASATEPVWTADRPVDQIRAWAQRVLLPALRTYGFRVERESQSAVLLIRRRSAWWLLPFSVLAFWLSPQQKDQVSLSFSAQDALHGRMAVLGEIPAKVRAILLDLPGCSEVPEGRRSPSLHLWCPECDSRCRRSDARYSHSIGGRLSSARKFTRSAAMPGGTRFRQVRLNTPGPARCPLARGTGTRPGFRRSTSRRRPSARPSPQRFALRGCTACRPVRRGRQ